MINIKKLKQMGIHNILVSSVINKIAMLLYNVAIVRILTKSDFGIFTSCWNTISIVAVFCGLGLNETLMQFSSETTDENKRSGYMKFAVSAGTITSLISAIFVMIYALNFKQQVENSALPLAVLAMVLIPQFVQMSAVMYFRSTLQNREYAITTNANTILFVGFSILGASLFGLYGTIAGKYIGFILSALVGLYFMRGNIVKIIKAKLPSKKTCIDMVKYGLVITLTNAVSQILYLLDIYVIGIVSGSADAIASYKTATIIPFALNFFPGIIITVIYPYFARNKDNKQWIRKKYLTITKYLFLINLVVTAGGIFFAPLIIKVLFGETYMDAVEPFKILMISYFFAGTFRTLQGNMCAMLRKVNVNLILGTTACVINVILDFILIKRYGSIGAAWATTLVTVISVFISTIYVFYYLKGNNKSSIK
ncbi:MAG: flippase [Oscillospiraceae bacterium]